MAARPVICRRGLAARASALARTMSGSRGPGGRTSRQGRPRRPLCLSARICFIVISLADLPCGVAVDAEPDVAGLALRPTLRAAAAAGVTRRCIGSGIFDSRHAGTTVLSGRQSWCRELDAAVWTGPPESPAWAVWSWTCTVRQVSAEHALGDRVQCAQRVPCMMCHWRASGSWSGRAVTMLALSGSAARCAATPRHGGRAGCHASSRRGRRVRR